MNNDETPIELWEYKYEEVVEYHISDFGEVPKDKVEEFNNKITDPNIDVNSTYNNIIRCLYINLLNSNIEILYEKIKNPKINTIGFSSIKWEMRQIENNLKKPQSIDDLKEIYIRKLKPIMLSVADNISKLKYKRKQRRNDKIIAILIAVGSIFLGAYLQKHDLMNWI